MSMDPLDAENVLSAEDWELEEAEVETHDWEPTSDSEEPPPDSPGRADEALAEEEPPPPSPQQEAVPPTIFYQAEEPEADDPYEESWDFSEPPSVMPPAGGADGSSEDETAAGGVAPQFILEPSDDALPPDYDAAATAMQRVVRGRSARAHASETGADGDGDGDDDDDDGDEANFELEPPSITPSVAPPAGAPPLDEPPPASDEVVSDYELVRPPRFAAESPMGVQLKAAERAAIASKVNKLPIASVAPSRPPPKYGDDALVDERPKAFKHDLPSLRANLRRLGPMGQQLQQLAIRHAALAKRTHKHTPHSQRAAVPEAEWWNCLLESLGLPDLATLGHALSVPGESRCG